MRAKEIKNISHKEKPFELRVLIDNAVSLYEIKNIAHSERSALDIAAKDTKKNPELTLCFCGKEYKFY